MYLTSSLRRALIIGGVAVLAVVCVVALTHRTPAAEAGYVNPAIPQAAPLNQYGNPEPVAPVNAAPAGQYAYEQAPVAGYATASANGPAGYAQPGARYAGAAYSGPGYGRPAYSGAAYSGPVVYAPSPFGAEYVVQPAPPPVAVEEETAPPAPQYVRRTYYRHGRRVVVTERRPFSHSVAIVGGSAAGGAAIGAIAGGGEGAAIGALAGGAGGFVYDRLTHKKKRVIVEDDRR